ncbi:MAG: spore coat protein [Cyanobacteria bacterium RYN_339]|nr:spore coat protein [Cyanobacteria bacterium RYN_339]
MALTACQPTPAVSPTPQPTGPVDEVAIALRPSPDGWTFADLDKDLNGNDDFAPSLPFTLANGATGTIAVRGQSTRGAAQKSYTLSLDKGQAPFLGTRHLLLNKHPFDLTRIRQTVALGLLGTIPELPAPHVAFAHLTIDGRDFGLFTRVERVDDDFMAARGLARDGAIYQAKDFDFHRRPGQLVDTKDPRYDPLSFEAILEIKGRKDHAKLLAMLDDVADPAQGAAELLAKHFDKPNYLAWLAANMLVGNVDTGTQNMFLYAPPDAGPWRLVAWDYDQALGWADQPGAAVQPADVPPRYDEGIALYWRSPLHRRVFQDPTLLAELTRRIDALAAGVLAPDRVAERAGAAAALVKPWISREPDRTGLPGPIDQYDAEVARLAPTIERRRALYHEVLARPMPFELDPPGPGPRFAWSPAIQLQGAAVRYEITVAATPDLANPVAHQQDLTAPAATFTLPPGRYYWQVIARTQGGAWQTAHARFADPASGRQYEGVAAFDAKPTI